MKITYPTVIPTAYLKDLTGSISYRNKTAKTLGKNCKNFVYEIFNYKKKNHLPEELTLNEIQSYYDIAQPNIIIKVLEKDPKIKHFGGYLGNIFLKNNLVGFFMGLNFKTNKKGEKILPKKNIIEFLHEDKHFNIEITNPKFSAKNVIFNNFFSLNKEKKIEINNFYKSNIYEPIPEKRNLSLNPKERCKFIRKNIKEFLTKNNFSSEEKIAILQNWRHKIKGEITAYRESFNDLVDLGLKNLKEKLKSGEKFEIKYKDTIIFNNEIISQKNKEKELLKFVKEKKKEGHKEQTEFFIFPEKLKLLESLLSKEIKAHRQNHSQQIKARKAT